MGDIIRAAATLRASHFVMIDEWDHAQDLPIWGVFDMRTVNQNSPLPGAVSIREAAIIVGVRYGRQSGAMYTRLVRGHRGRVFPSEDAAVMYALSMLQTQHAFDFARQ